MLEKIMKALNLLKTPIAAQLIPSFKKTERRLLSVFMRVLDIIPEFRGHILELVDYRGGRSSTYKSYMEPSFDLLDTPALRPDGLLTCKRGTKEWSALVEAKADRHPIRLDQIIDYIGIGKLLEIDAIISISNEFASAKGELPYSLPNHKRKGITVHHLSWSRIAAEMNMFLEESTELHHAERMVLQEAIRYFASSDSGVSTFDQMSPSWKDFVESANTVIGFSTNTPGVAEIVKDWQQERRDLCIKLNQQIGGGVETWFPAKLRKDLSERKKQVRELLTKEYQLEVVYAFKETKTKLRVIADLKAYSQTFIFECAPPKGKQIRAFTTWLAKLLDIQLDQKLSILLDWPGRTQSTVHKVEDIIQHPEAISNNYKDPPTSISFITTKQGAKRFKSRKLFIEDLEAGAKSLIDIMSRMELL
jgi:plasmid maintenance system antidote protein VapI